MKVILTKDVAKLGNVGEVVEVKSGYGRNFLIPKGLAVEFRRQSAKFLENEKKKLEIKHKKLAEEAKKLSEQLGNISCTIAMPSGEDDKLYGQVTPEIISNFYKQEGMDIDKRKIYLEKPIRNLGVYQAKVKLHPEISVDIKVWVVKK